MNQNAHYEDDVAFLKKHTEIVELRNGRAAVAVAPAYQGRVMTSSYDAGHGPGFGWINRPVIEMGVLAEGDRKGRLEEHLHVFGGEERLWLGPEGGQFSIFFKPRAKFDFSEWVAPVCIDTEAYAVKSRSTTEVVFEHEAVLRNWSGTEFKIGITRAVRLLDSATVEKRLGVALAEDAEWVAYETENILRNRGERPWTRETGMLSIWILGMYPPSPGTRVVIPFHAGSDEVLGPRVNDSYFGKVPPGYLQVDDDMLFFKGDGTHRAKIGIGPERAKGVAGGYDRDAGVLTIVTYTEPEGSPVYVNSMWEIQKDPFSGDVINAYNDGSPVPGAAPLGPSYEIETSSPAAGLQPGEALTHVQTTIHLRASRETMNRISENVLGTNLERIEAALQ